MNKYTCTQTRLDLLIEEYKAIQTTIGVLRDVVDAYNTTSKKSNFHIHNSDDDEEIVEIDIDDISKALNTLEYLEDFYAIKEIY